MEEQKSKNNFLRVVALLGVMAAVAGAVIALCKYFKPDYLAASQAEWEDDYEEE